MRRHLMYLVPLTACFFTLALTTGCKEEEKTETNCDDNVDNDGNGLTDCADPACADVAICQLPECGDGVAEGTEDCDGADLGGGTCMTEGFDAGTLTCSATCTYVTTACTNNTPDCGNGTIDTGEECDGTNLNSETCLTLLHDGGTLTCNPTTCLFDETACTDTVTCDVIDDTDSVAIAQQAAYDSAGPYWNYQRVMDIGGAFPFILSLQIYGNMGTAPTTGVHALGVGDEANYATCIYCPMLYACDDAECAAASTTFFPTAGSLDLTALGAATDEHITGSLTDVNWIEVTIDGETFESTPVVGGDCYDLDPALTFDATVTAQ